MTTELSVDERADLLRHSWLFSGCSGDELTRIASLTSVRDVPAGAELTTEGEPGQEFFVVVSGAAHATVDGDEVGRLAAGSFFGEMALIDGGDRMATVTATVAMRLLVLDRHDFNEMLQVAMPSVVPKLLAVVGARMRTLERHAGINAALGL